MKQVVATTLESCSPCFCAPLAPAGGGPLAGPSQPPAATGTLPIDRTVVTPGQTADGRVQVRVALGDGEVLTLPLDKYLWRVVAAECPPPLEPEALKAQTVAARTYTPLKMERTVEAHPDADVCTDITSTRPTSTRRTPPANWGERPDLHRQDRRRRGGYRRHGGPLSGPAHPGGVLLLRRRKDGGRGGGVGQRGALPHQRGQPRGGTRCPTTTPPSRCPWTSSKSKLLAQYPQADLSGEPAGWFANLVPNSAGGVETVDIGGVTVGGGSLRTLFGLRSTSFTVSASADGVTFSVTGYGHGVGMSQYGANALAKEGKTYDEILKWYYTGIDVAPIRPRG